MNDSKTVVVLGGGVGGVVAAIALRKRLPPAHRVVVVDRSSSHLFSPSLLWLMTGSRSESKIARPMERLSRRGIEFIRRHAGGGRPFCCFVSTAEPHDPYVPPKRFLDMYDVAAIPLSPTLRCEEAGKPDVIRRMRSVWRDRRHQREGW